MTLIIALGLVNWFATYLVVESEFFRSLREWIERKERDAKRQFTYWFWGRMDYLFNCHTCSGTWVGLVLAPFAPSIFGGGFFSYIVVALLIKSIGHLTLVVHKFLEGKTKCSSE